MVKAGEGSYLFDWFYSDSIIAVGWNDVGDLSELRTRELIRARLAHVYNESRVGWLANITGQLFRFAVEIKIGETIVTYDSSSRDYWIGEVVGDYHFDDTGEYYNQRKVLWKTSVSRDRLSQPTKNTLGSAMTVIELSSALVDELVNASTLPRRNLTQEPIAHHIEESALAEDTFDLSSITAQAHERIKDILVELSWQQMQELVAALLRAMGYKTRVSPPGADRGRDVQASPDGLGLEEPRIVVEVKHRKQSADPAMVRSFIGGLRASEKGIFVSTGGFTREALYEIQRSPVPVSHIDLDMLANLTRDNYERFDAEGKALVRLQKVYFPA